jgi:ribosomal protein S18 acetylase RimI-like enzyme
MTTHPAHKGHGVASMMLKEAFKQVDAAGLKTIVMASAAGKGLYEKQGFKLVSSLAQNYSKYGITEPYIHHWLLRETHE